MQLPPSRYRDKMVSKEGNTTPLLISSEQQNINMVSLLLPLESIYHNPGLPGRTGKILVLKFKLGSVFQPTRSLLFKSAIYT